MQANHKSPRGIVLYGVGNVGLTIAQLIAQRGWPINCAANRQGHKIGKSLAELTSTSELNGIVVKDASKINFSDLDADIAIVAVNDRLDYNQAIHRQLLEAGLNVICLGAESSFPWAANAELAKEYDAIARSNGVTFTGSGLWDTYRIWSLKTLLGPCTSLRTIHHQSVTNADKFGDEVIRLAGVGEKPEVSNNTANATNSEESSIYRVLLPQVVNAIGLTATNISERKEPVVLDEPVFCSTLNRTIEPGLCVGTRSIIEVSTQQGIDAIAEIDLRLTKENESEWIGWSVDGDPPVSLKLERINTGHATASSVVNRIPDVIAAQSGIVTVDKLPTMQPYLQ